MRLLSFTRVKLKGRGLDSAQEANYVFYNCFRAGILSRSKPLQTLQPGLFIISSPPWFYPPDKLHLLSHNFPPVFIKHRQLYLSAGSSDQHDNQSTLNVHSELTEFQSKAQTPDTWFAWGTLSWVMVRESFCFGG